MTFLERYRKEDTWHGKAMIMEIYHLAMSYNVKNWTISKTAEHFSCSIGLVSENLKLAQAIHISPAIMTQTSRQDALNWLSKGRIVNG